MDLVTGFMDRLLRCFLSGFALSLVLIIASCSPNDDPGVGGGGSADDKPALVTNLNGYQYEGTFKETKDVVQYGFPSIKHLESYHDSVRVIFSTYDDVLIRYRWTVQNRYQGKVTREFDIGEGNAPDGDKYQFAFNNQTFQLYGYEKATSNIVTYSKGSKSAYYLSKPNNNFPYRFNENYTVFFGSASTIYVHENKLQKYTAPAPNIAYVLTSEPSVSWADYFFNDDAASGTLFREEIYTGFFNATLNSNYIGIAKGQQTLDTLFINKNVPTIYYSGTSVYLSKDDQKIYLTLIKLKGPSSSSDISFFEMDINEKIIRPVFQNKDLPGVGMTAFVRGKLYFNTKVMNRSGALEDLLLPTLVANANVTQIIFGETKMFLIVQKDVNMLEVYSKAY